MSVPLPAVEQLSARVWRVLGLNPGKFTLQGTNTYLVGTGDQRLLIDTGEANKAEYTSLLGTTLHKLQARVSQIVLTHWHHDHLGGLPDVLNKVCAGGSPRVYKFLLERSADEGLHYPLRGEGNMMTVSMPAEIERQITYLKDGDVLTTEGATLRVIATPGHTKDHLSLWLDEEKAVFTGDCVLGEGSAVFEELSSYMTSLEKLLALCPQTLYPGHGPVLKDGQRAIKQYITHRNAREKQVTDYLECCTEPVTSYQMVQHIYKDVDQILWLGAENNVRLHLEKLLKEGRVVRVAGDTDGEYVWKLQSKI